MMLVANSRKHPMPYRLALLVIGLTLITGCGFKLRGSIEMPSALSKIFIEGGNRVFNEQLIERLQQSGAVVVEAENNNAITLSISKSAYQRSVRTIDAIGLATSYDYTYAVDYQVRDSNERILLPLTTIYQQRTLDYDSAQVLQVEDEEAFLKKQMEQEIILQLLRRLSQIVQVL